MMYRFLLFAYRSYEERGGIADLVLTFNTVEELQEAIYENDEHGIGLGFNNIFDIYDVKKNEVYCYETDDYSEDVLDEFVEKLLDEKYFTNKDSAIHQLEKEGFKHVCDDEYSADWYLHAEIVLLEKEEL